MQARLAKWILVALVFSLLPAVPSRVSAVTAPQLTVSPLQISPNGDGDRETLAITVTLAEDAQEQVRILDSANNPVAYIHGYWNRTAGTYRYSFNGKVKDSTGTEVPLPEAYYFVEASTKDSAGAVSATRARFSINNTLKNVSVTSTPLSYNTYTARFSPNGDGRKDQVVVKLTLLRPANVVTRVTYQGKVVREYQQSYADAGLKSLMWDGKVKDSSGNLVPAPTGSYGVQLVATPIDPGVASRIGPAYAGRVMISDLSKPSINSTISRSTINLSQNQYVTFTHTTSEPGYRMVDVVDAAGKVLYSAPWTASSTTGTFVWRGQTSAGGKVPSGDYWIKVYFQDNAGNAANYYPSQRKVTVVTGTLSGRSSKTPWSGYWWPMLNTYATKLYNNPGPMTRYDAANGTRAYAWEKANHSTTDSANDWWGHCQAWAAAAIMEAQPPGRTFRGIWFSQDDAEGLYAETWNTHTGWMYGTRYNGEGTSSTAYQDVFAADFDRLVRYWIGDMKTPLMMDFTTGTAVWNYPVYAYSRSSVISGSKEYVTMKVTRAAPSYGVNGTSPMVVTFYYTLESGTRGRWYNPYGSSVNTHPDYLFRVGGRATDYGNPYVKVSTLNSMFR